MQRKLIPLITALIVLTGCSGVIAWIGLIQSGASSETETIVGDAARGADLFHKGIDDVPPCSDCHRVGGLLGGIALGPNLSGLQDRAARRVEGLSAEAYIAESILDPSAYVVRGFRGSMYNNYGDHYDDQDIADLTAYLLSL